jgi:hypothetical protein
VRAIALAETPTPRHGRALPARRETQPWAVATMTSVPGNVTYSPPGATTTVAESSRGAHRTNLIINGNYALPAIPGLSIQKIAGDALRTREDARQQFGNRHRERVDDGVAALVENLLSASALRLTIEGGP